MGKGKLQDSFISGLIIVAPLLLTILILKVLFDWTLIFIDPVVQGTRLSSYTNFELLAQVIALGLVILGLTLLGILARNRYGRKLIGRVGGTVHIIPVFRTLYFTIKQVTNAVTEQEHRFQKAVLVEYPQEDNYRIGFVTSEATEEVQERHQKDLAHVFLPQSPNPTAGQLAIIPEEDIEEIDMSVKKALKLLMTSGMTAEREELPEHLIIEEGER